MNSSFVVRGNLCHSKDVKTLESMEKGYVVCEKGVCAGMFLDLPEAYQGLPLLDFGQSLVIPGLVDLHVHAPQYAFRGLGMDMELLDWLNARVFPEEARYRDLEYAKRAYSFFVEDLKKSSTTRACIFATLHSPATILLMDMLEASGLVTLVGKVNMDRNGPSVLQEESAAFSAGQTLAWLEQIDGRYSNTAPIITPRFIPSCSDELMTALSEIRGQRKLPVQSHLSENPSEGDWVRSLCPDASCYGDAYQRFGLFGGNAPTIMAHCVWCDDEESEMLRRNNVFVAHCPQSNMNLSSGIAPVRRFLDRGIRVGLGSDVAGGCHISIFRAMADAIQCSKLRWRLVDPNDAPLAFAEAFYMGTAGGGAFFAEAGGAGAGAFVPGYDFDALVIDDSAIATPHELGIEERLERAVYFADERHIAAKFARGRRIV